MKDINETSRTILSKICLPFSFFLLYFLSVYLTINPALIYHGGCNITNFPVFFTTPQFLHEHLIYSAGPIKYIYAFIAQFLYFNSAGTIIITAQAFLIFISLTYIAKKLNANALRSLSYLPPLIILFLYNHYTFHFEAFNTIAIQLLLFCLYLKLPRKIKPITIILASPLIYYIVGPPLLYLITLCFIYELLFHKNYNNAFLYAVSAAIIPYTIGTAICNINIIDSYCDMLPFSWKTTTFTDRSKLLSLVYLLYALPIAIIIIAAIFSITNKNKKQQKNKKSLNKTIALAAILAIALSATSLAYDKKQKAFFAVEYHSYHKNWQKLLNYADKLPYNLFAVHNATRALYHTGKLNEEMFKYPQHPNALLFTDNNILHSHLTVFDTYLDLGIINLAEHYLSRNMSYFGERDIFLQRLAWIHMLKANKETAKTFLTALSKTLFMKDWANEQLNAIKNDPTLAFPNDSKIQAQRKNMIKNDNSMSLMLPEDFLTSLQDANPKNKMAFDYLLAWYLVTKNTEKFTKSLDQLPKFGYKKLPAIYQQAILMHIYSTKKDVNMQNYEIPPEMVEYAKQFYILMNKYPGNQQLKLEELNEKYGDTYLYYFIRRFNQMPKFTGRLK